MASNNESKLIDFKNRIFYYVDEMINVNDLDFDNILLYGISYGHYLIYNVAYKTP